MSERPNISEPAGKWLLPILILGALGAVLLQFFDQQIIYGIEWVLVHLIVLFLGVA